MAEIVETMLIGHSTLTPPIADGSGAMLGFVIDNPSGPDLRVSLQQLTLKGATAEENNQLRQAVYDAYALGTKAVPAFTPLSECVAESATLIVHSDAEWEGMRFVFVPVKEKSATGYYANIQGNPLLPDNRYDFSYNGVTQTVTLEQQNKNYLGKDGRWYITNPLELITHELAHGCNKLQGWSQAGEKAYVSDLKAGKVPDYEIKAINFVNTTLLEPRGLPGRNPETYYAAKPDGALQGQYIPLDAAGLEKLKHGPIPAELKQYTQPARMPEATDLQGKSYLNLLHPCGDLSQALTLSGLCSESQSVVIAQRIRENAAMSPASDVMASHHETAREVLCQ